MKTKLAIVSILVLLAVLVVVGLGVSRIRLERRKATLYAAAETALTAHQWNEALAQFEALSALDPNYRNIGHRLNEAHYLAGVAYLETGQFDRAVSELGQVALDYRDAE
ncbi:MAG: tetratricopeptide repeat protein, partial [Anaerolineae bacterium]